MNVHSGISLETLSPWFTMTWLRSFKGRRLSHFKWSRLFTAVGPRENCNRWHKTAPRPEWFKGGMLIRCRSIKLRKALCLGPKNNFPTLSSHWVPLNGSSSGGVYVCVGGGSLLIPSVKTDELLITFFLWMVNIKTPTFTFFTTTYFNNLCADLLLSPVSVRSSSLSLKTSSLWLKANHKRHLFY